MLEVQVERISTFVSFLKRSDALKGMGPLWSRLPKPRWKNVEAWSKMWPRFCAFLLDETHWGTGRFDPNRTIWELGVADSRYAT